MSKEQDQVFFRNFSLIVGGLAAMMAAFFVVAQVAGGNDEMDAERRAQTVAEMTAPVGQVAVAGEQSEPAQAAGEGTEPNQILAQAADSGAVDGEKIYGSMCVACHGIEGIGAPILGDKAGWAPRIAQGMDVLYDRAINGYTGPGGYMMPARGGGNFSDEEVKAAVDYMVSQGQ